MAGWLLRAVKWVAGAEARLKASVSDRLGPSGSPPEPSDDLLSGWLRSGAEAQAARLQSDVTEQLATLRQQRPMERRPDWAALAAAAAALAREHPALWDDVVGAYEQHQYDHYLLQRDSGMSRDDLGEPMSRAQAARFLCSYARDVFEALPAPLRERGLHRVAVLETE